MRRLVGALPWATLAFCGLARLSVLIYALRRTMIPLQLITASCPPGMRSQRRLRGHPRDLVHTRPLPTSGTGATYGNFHATAPNM